MVRHKSILSIIGKSRSPRPESARKKNSNKAKVPCHCNKCNGKLVLKRTKLFHDSSTIQEDTANIRRNEGQASVNTQHEGRPSGSIQRDEDPSPQASDIESAVSEHQVTQKRSRRYESPQTDTSDSEDDHMESSENSENSDKYEGESNLNFGKNMKIIWYQVMNNVNIENI